MLRVYNYDGVIGEVGHEDLDLPEDAGPLEVYKADQYHFPQESGEYDRHLTTEMPGLTIMNARWGRDAQYSLWWGEKAAEFAKLIGGYVA